MRFQGRESEAAVRSRPGRDLLRCVRGVRHWWLTKWALQVLPGVGGPDVHPSLGLQSLAVAGEREGLPAVLPLLVRLLEEVVKPAVADGVPSVSARVRQFPDLVERGDRLQQPLGGSGDRCAGGSVTLLSGLPGDAELFADG